MGLRVIAVDSTPEKLLFCESLGAELGIDAGDPHVVHLAHAEQVHEYTRGGAHAVLCVATHRAAFQSAVKMCRPRGTVVFVGMPAGDIVMPVVDIVLRCLTIRGSLVGTRQDLIEALDFAARGLVKCNLTLAKLEEVNDVMQKLKKNAIEGRVVLQM
mmetsp:Transcript_782/g.1170  ORF Transcript_782/g.1170 Transcript_782/m.1170 type:complete len:157 (-) Transcript_782:2747-3217(-)